MEKVDQFEKCDECEELVDTYIEFYSRRGDVVKVCLDCICKAITKITTEFGASKPLTNLK